MRADAAARLEKGAASTAASRRKIRAGPLIDWTEAAQATGQERHILLIEESREACERARRVIAVTLSLAARVRREAERREAFP